MDYIIISIYECWIDHHVRCGKIGTSPNEGHKNPPLYRLLKKQCYTWSYEGMHGLVATCIHLLLLIGSRTRTLENHL